MVVTVHAPSRAAAPYRAGLIALIGFLAVSSLAVDISRRRSSGDPLADRVVLRSLGVSVRLPRRFQQVETFSAGKGVTQVFGASTADDDVALLVISRVARDHAGTSAAAGEDALRFHRSRQALPAAAKLTMPTPVNFGSTKALEFRDPGTGAAIRVGELATGEFLVFSLSKQNGAIDKRLYRAFDLSCQTVDYLEQSP